MSTARGYIGCGTCNHARTVKIGESKAKDERYYVCPNCNQAQTWTGAVNGVRSGIPPEVEQAAMRSGRLGADGRLPSDKR